MAKFRLISPHFIGGHYLPSGTEVGDGTPHVVKTPSVLMEALDDKASALLKAELARAEKEMGSGAPGLMNLASIMPVKPLEFSEKLPMTTEVDYVRPAEDAGGIPIFPAV